MLARCIQHETDHLDGVLFVDRLDAETRKAAMRAIREARVVRPGQRRRSRSARTASDALRRVRLVFAGTPATAVPVAARAARLAAARGRRRRHPARRPAPGAGRARAASPVAALADERGIPVLTPRRPGRPGVPRPAARTRASTAARSSPTARCCRPRRSTVPRARLGQPALLAAARVARRGAGAARDPARRRDHRRLHVPARAGPGHRPGVRRGHRGDPARRHRRRPARPAGRVAAPGCWSPPSTASPTAPLVARPQPADGVSLRAARSPSTTPGSTGPRRLARRPAGARLHPGAGRVDDVPRRAAQARAGAAARRDTTWRPASSRVEQGRRRWSAPRPTDVELGEVQPPGKTADAGRRLGARRAHRAGESVG